MSIYSSFSFSEFRVNVLDLYLMVTRGRTQQCRQMVIMWHLNMFNICCFDGLLFTWKKFLLKYSVSVGNVLLIQAIFHLQRIASRAGTIVFGGLTYWWLKLSEICRPVIIFMAVNFPMIPVSRISSSLDNRNNLTETRWRRRGRERVGILHTYIYSHVLSYLRTLLVHIKIGI